jgi:small-conductance mechanosensitive channel
LLRGFRYVVGRTKTTLDDRIIKSTQPYLFPIAVFSAIWLGLEVAIPQGFSIGNFSIMDIYIIILLAIMSLMFSSLSDAFLLWYGLEIRSHKKKIRESEVYPFVRNVVKLAVLLLFLVFILQRMGFDTTAIITGLGIGGLAVALALQKTLENFFAGIHLLMDRPFRQYDYIKLESGQEGIVTEIGWRTTRLETVGKDEIVIPNSSLAGSIMTNFSSRMDKTGVLYELSVDYHEDANKVENLIISAINAVQKENEYVVPDTTWARLDSFGEYALNFKFGYLVKGYTNQWGVLREVNHQIFSIFKKNGVNMPLPVRRVIRKSALNKNKK